MSSDVSSDDVGDRLPRQPVSAAELFARIGWTNAKGHAVLVLAGLAVAGALGYGWAGVAFSAGVLLSLISVGATAFACARFGGGAGTMAGAYLVKVLALAVILVLADQIGPVEVGGYTFVPVTYLAIGLVAGLALSLVIDGWLVTRTPVALDPTDDDENDL